MTLDALLNQLDKEPELIDFNQVIDLIQSLYNYEPSRFTNGLGQALVVNEAGTNEGSCKLFAFAKAQGLTKSQTLACFGRYYRDDVLKSPEGRDHANIRTFMKYGWEGIQFDSLPLTKK